MSMAWERFLSYHKYKLSKCELVFWYPKLFILLVLLFLLSLIIWALHLLLLLQLLISNLLILKIKTGQNLAYLMNLLSNLLMPVLQKPQTSYFKLFTINQKLKQIHMMLRVKRVKNFHKEIYSIYLLLMYLEQLFIVLIIVVIIKLQIIFLLRAQVAIFWFTLEFIKISLICMNLGWAWRTEE